MAEIQVAPDRVALVDDADLELVSALRWRLLVAGRATKTQYAQAWAGGKTVLMHRLILGALGGEMVDHRNHDGLDNRRANLRLCTPQQNMFNRRANGGVKSGLKGVSFHQVGGGRGTKKWQARASLNRKSRHLGYFATPEEAHAAYAAFAIANHGEFACP